MRNHAPSPISGSGGMAPLRNIRSATGNPFPERSGGTPTGSPPQIDFNYRNLRVKIDGGRTTTRSGTMRFANLEPLPRREHVFLLQCGAPAPRGIVKWTGVRFSDVAEMLGAQSFARYARFVGSDNYFVEEDMTTMMHPQVLLAWMLDDEPIPPEHGAPLRLVVPFRWGARSVKAITEIQLTATSFPAPPRPPNA